MIVIVLDRNQLCQAGAAAYMIAVPVRGDVVIDLRQPGNFERYVSDATGVAVARKSGINQQRLARRGNDQRRSPALNVNEINIKGLRRGLTNRRKRKQDCGKQSER